MVEPGRARLGVGEEIGVDDGPVGDLVFAAAQVPPCVVSIGVRVAMANSSTNRITLVKR
jgi:hypothetical protein